MTTSSSVFMIDGFRVDPERAFNDGEFCIIIDHPLSPSLLSQMEIVAADDDEESKVLDAYNDNDGAVVVDLINHQPIDSDVFATLLRPSLSMWKQQGKIGVWIKLPINLTTLAEAAFKEGFQYDHAEPTHVIILVYWFPKTPCTPPANASGGVSIPAVVNNNIEVVVVQENHISLNGTESKGDTWKNPGLFNLVDNFLAHSTAQINLCDALANGLNRARRSQFNLNVALQQSCSNEYSRTLQEIEKFKASGDPSGNEFFLLFQQIYGNQMSMSNKLQAEKFKLDKKLRLIKGWRKLSSVLFVVTFASVLICSVVAAAIEAPPVVAALAAAAAVPLGSIGKWVDTIYSKYENTVKTKLDFIGSMERGTSIMIKDLDNIRVLVSKLEIKMDVFVGKYSWGYAIFIRINNPA